MRDYFARIRTIFRALTPLLFLFLIVLFTLHRSIQAQENEGESVDLKATDSSATLDDLKNDIRKNTILKSTTDGVTFEERDIYYETLGQLSDFSVKFLKDVSESNLKNRWTQSRFKEKPFAEFPIYVDLFQNPETYHGEVVTLRGHAQRVVKSPAGDNEFGITDLYEIWMFTDDSQSNPAVIVTPNIPESLPVGDNITDHITVTGIFFKFYTYNAQDTKRFAPLILAPAIELRDPTAVSEQSRAEDMQYYLFFIGQFVLLLIVAIAIGFFWGKIGTRRRMQEFQLESVGHEPPVSDHVALKEHDDSSNDPNSDDGKP